MVSYSDTQVCFLKGCEVELVLDSRYWRKMLVCFSIHVCISYWIGMWSHPAFVWVESHCSAWMSIRLSTAFDITLNFLHRSLPLKYCYPPHISLILPVPHSFRLPSHTSATALSSQCQDVSAHHNPTSTPISVSAVNSVSNAFHSHSCSFCSGLCLPESIYLTCTRFSPGSSHKRISTRAVGHGSVKAVLGSASTGRRIITMRTYCARPSLSQRPRNRSSLAGDPACTSGSARRRGPRRT
jgi:hypothetical protein